MKRPPEPVHVKFLRIVVAIGVVLVGSAFAANGIAAESRDDIQASSDRSGSDRPHVVYLLADDLGWRDVGFHQGAPRTPHLDRLAANGAMLNAFYAQPFSSQTRAAMLTGRYPMRYGLQTLSITSTSDYGLPTEERTFAQALKTAAIEPLLSAAGCWDTQARNTGQPVAASTIFTAR